MSVYQIETEMPAPELVEWFAHFHLSKGEAEREAKKQKNRGRR